jgi:hypothetical protein
MGAGRFHLLRSVLIQGHMSAPTSAILEPSGLAPSGSQRLARKALMVAILIALILITAALSARSTPFVNQLVLFPGQANARAVELPYAEDMPANVSYTLSGEMYRSWLSGTRIHITPDDRLDWMRVNGELVSFAGIDPALLKDYDRGFDIDLGKYLKEGANSIEFKITNFGGNSGIAIGSSSVNWYRDCYFDVFCLLVLLLWYVILTAFQVKRGIIFLLLGGLALRLAYLGATLFNIRGYDVDGHLEYIEFICNNWALPDTDFGWSTYHPPLYYFLAAAVYKTVALVPFITKSSILKALQFASLMMFSVFLVVCARIVERCLAAVPGIKKERLALLAVSLLVFWPSTIVHSVRIGNDVPLYLFYGLGFFYLIRWDQESKTGDLFKSAACGALGIATKSNALVLCGVIAAALGWKYFRDAQRLVRWRGWLRQALLTSAILLAGFGFNFGTSFLRTVEPVSHEHLLVKNAGALGNELFIGNTAANYLWFDSKAYVTRPFTDPYDDASGRQFHWNYLLTTSLWGEFKYPGAVAFNLASIINMFVLGMVLYLFVSIACLAAEHYHVHAIVLFNLLFLFAAGLLFKMSVPASCSGDFRYILPVLPSCCVLYGLCVSHWADQDRNRLKWTGIVMVVALVVLSCVFFIAVAFGS